MSLQKVNQQTGKTTQIAGNGDISIDLVPTQGSANAVQSGGVYNSLDPVYNVLGAKNIVPNVAKTQTVNGITYTANSDGSITINGTATGWAQSYVIQGLLHKGTYKISIGTALPTKVWATLRNVDASSSILNLGNGSSIVEKSFTLSSDTNVGLFCGIEGGITVNNLTVYPMIRPASITDDTYVPYSRTNQELTGEVEPMLNVLGAKNLLPNNAVSKTVNGITFTVNSDGSIGISSTNSETNGSYSVSDEFLLKKGSYKLSRGKHSTPCPSLYIAKASDFSLIAELTTDSGTEEISFTLDADVKVKCWMWYIANNAYNTTFYPMIRPASIQDDTYVPYSMTNKQLTDCVAKNYSFSVSFDGEKTVRDVLNELETMIENYITNNPSRLLVVLNIRSFALDMNCPVGITSNNIPGGFAFGGAMYMSNGANKIHAGSIRTSNSQLKYSIGDAVTDLTLTKPTSGNIQARCILF